MLNHSHGINTDILLFHQINRAHHNAIWARMAQNRLQDVNNPMLLFILAQALEQEGQMVPSQKHLARLLRVSPATVANSLKSLERNGFVRKEPDPTDARRNRVYITDRGREAVTRCTEVFAAVDEQTLAGFSPEEKRQLNGFHRRILENLNQIGGDRDAPPCSAFTHGKE